MSPDWGDMRHLSGRDFIPDTADGILSWLEKYVPAEDRDQVLSAIREAIETRSFFELQHRVIRQNGSVGWVFSRAVPLLDAKGEILEWFGTIRDITKQKQAQEDLERANRDLEQFAFSASHDLQEPLRTIKIYSELLVRRNAVHDENGAQYLDYLHSAASRMELLVRDLLAYTQVTRLEAPLVEVDANEILQTTLSDLTGSVAASRGEITFDPLPSIRVHRTLLKQLFQNLIGNAIKYRAPDREPRVHVSAERKKGTWTFSVQDNGIGIEPEYLKKIFGMFTRLHTSREYSGTGIGLAICQRIVERYGGVIWVESTPGVGSIFRFTLPL
jgi:light-regulated signal transduction histidine kinase (bacteriophytochrome)